MTAPNQPTAEEVEGVELYWEYDQVQVDVSTMADPPGSLLPHIIIRRRMVSQWETYWPEEDR